ncbi:MAG: zinc-ribbon domain-containing protein [Acidobacteria bacterium]|nr:zinc-ribbon domain-containing protein [Acidobacteriota bacterium]MBU4202632.1 zinc-ribbon domain-containing protein [Acidobacteriota bacterium]
MMDKQFENFKKEFDHLKKLYKNRAVSKKEFKSRLKLLQLKDEHGRCWTIGAQTGEWYYFDGSTWIKAKPPSLSERRVICIYCGRENDLVADSCRFCGEGMDEGDHVCPDCGKPLKKGERFCVDCGTKDLRSEETAEFPDERSGEIFIVRSILPMSLSLVFGGFGLLVGIVLGVFAGATELLSSVHQLMPAFIHNLRSSLGGGVIYGLFGGLYGFLSMWALGFLLAFLTNISISMFDGIKVRIEKKD